MIRNVDWSNEAENTALPFFLRKKHWGKKLYSGIQAKFSKWYNMDIMCLWIYCHLLKHNIYYGIYTILLYLINTGACFHQHWFEDLIWKGSELKLMVLSEIMWWCWLWPLPLYRNSGVVLHADCTNPKWKWQSCSVPVYI